MSPSVKAVFRGVLPLQQIAARKESQLRWPAFLFGLFVFLAAALPSPVETVLALAFLFFPVTVWASSNQKIPTEIVRLAGPLFLIALVGMLSFTGHKAYDVIKDVWYILNPALALVTGYVLMLNLKELDRLFRVFIITATLIALFHLLRIAMHPELLNKTATDIRSGVGTGFFATALALALFLVAGKMKLRLFEQHTWFAYLALCICCVSTIMTFSRFMEASLFIICICVMGWLNFDNRKRVLLFITFAVTVIGVGMALPPRQTVGSHLSLPDKVLNSFQELKIKESYNMQEINTYWRGFETSRALITYERGTFPEYMVGQGLGSTIDLGLYMKLGDEQIRFAPILHNGYMYLLVKTGIVGVFIYLFLLFRMGRTGVLLSRSEHTDRKYIGRLILGLTLAIVASTFVVSGMFNKSAILSALLLTGALFAYERVSEQKILKQDGE
jgi:hypothetical protein